MKGILVQFVLLAATTSHAQEQNYTASYFQSAELQLETRVQCREIRAALSDMLKNPPFVLKSARYKDHQGKSDQWGLTELLGHYIVPARAVRLDERKLFNSYRSKFAKKSIHKTLTQLGDCNAYSGD